MAERRSGPGSSAELSGVYALTAGVMVVDRGPDGVQIGTEPPLSMLWTPPPRDAAGTLQALDGSASLGDVLGRRGGEPALWVELVGQLLAVGLAGSSAVPPATRGEPGMLPELVALAHRHAADDADTILRRRRESLVRVAGSGRLAGWVALLLAASGVGHVHHRPDRPVRPIDLIPGRAGDRNHSGSASDEEIAADRIARLVDHAQLHSPAGQNPPDLHILAGDGPSDPVDAAVLIATGVPHLAVWAGPASGVVGPLVLPGRSSCLNCADLYRSDRDPWSGRVDAVRRTTLMPPASLTAVSVAALAVREVLDHLEGLVRPTTVDGNWDWRPDGVPRRRSRMVHPDCGCQLLQAD